MDSHSQSAASPKELSPSHAYQPAMRKSFSQDAIEMLAAAVEAQQIENNNDHIAEDQEYDEHNLPSSSLTKSFSDKTMKSKSNSNLTRPQSYNLELLSKDELKQRYVRSVLQKSTIQQKLNHHRKLSRVYQQTITKTADDYEELIQENNEQIRQEYELKLMAERHQTLKQEMKVKELEQQLNAMKQQLLTPNSSSNHSKHRREPTPFTPSTPSVGTNNSNPFAAVNYAIMQQQHVQSSSPAPPPPPLPPVSSVGSLSYPYPQTMPPQLQTKTLSFEAAQLLNEDPNAKLMQAMSPRITSFDQFALMSAKNNTNMITLPSHQDPHPLQMILSQEGTSDEDAPAVKSYHITPDHQQRESRESERYDSSSSTDDDSTFPSLPEPSNKRQKYKKSKKKKKKLKHEPTSFWDIMINCFTPSICDNK